MAATELFQKAFDYSVRVSEMVRFLREDNKGFSLCDRLLYCGVGVGLCCRRFGENSEPDPFEVKRAKSHLEEIDYIVDMAVRAGYLTEKQSVHIREDGRNLAELLENWPAEQEPLKKLP